MCRPLLPRVLLPVSLVHGPWSNLYGDAVVARLFARHTARALAWNVVRGDALVLLISGQLGESAP